MEQGPLQASLKYGKLWEQMKILAGRHQGDVYV
jgi:hypothetical protein